MVMFKEDEERIKEQEKLEKLSRRTRIGNLFRLFTKIGLFVAIFLGIGLYILSMLGGSSDTLKGGVEEYLSQASGMEAKIGTFNEMSFFPYIEVDVADVAFYKRGEKRKLMSVGSANFSAGFFDLMFSKNKFKSLDIKKVRATTGVLAKKSIMIDQIAFQEEVVDQDPALVISGSYGGEELNAYYVMGRPDYMLDHYIIPDTSNFKANIGDFEVEGSLERGQWGKLILTLDKIQTAGMSASGQIAMTKSFFKNHLDGQFTAGKSEFDIDTRFDDQSAKITINFDELFLEDVPYFIGMYEALQKLPFFDGGSGVIDFYGQDLEIHLNADKINAAHASLGKIYTATRLVNQRLETEISGQLNKGELSGKAILNAKKSPSTLEVKAKVKDWDYGDYQQATLGQENVSGTGNIHAILFSSAESYNELIPNLSGDFVLVAGEGKFSKKTLNIWGSGLMNVMLPNLSGEDLLTMNCMIADFKIEKGVARPEPLFMDTARLTVMGEGEIDFVEDKIDLKLEPKSKDIAVLDIASAVNVKGSVFKPEIGADTFSLFEKLGGLALGFINPAFLAVSLTDLGLGDDHPCRKFIGSEKEPANENKDVPNEEVDAERKLNE